MPLGCNGWKLAGQIIFTGNHLFPSAYGTAATTHTGFDLRLPRMTFFADPPDRSMTSGQNLSWSKTVISCWTPLICQFRKKGGQIVLSRLRNLTSSDRAAGSGIYRRLPVLAFFTTPPDVAFAAPGNSNRSKREIGVCYPFIQQFLTPFPDAEIVQVFPHGQSSLHAESTFCPNICCISRIIHSNYSKYGHGKQGNF